MPSAENSWGRKHKPVAGFQNPGSISSKKTVKIFLKSHYQ
jgi:hypothetical protein